MEECLVIVITGIALKNMHCDRSLLYKIDMNLKNLSKSNSPKIVENFVFSKDKF